MIEWSNAPQGTEEWLSIRKGVITGSQFKTCREKLKNGNLTSKALLYAMDTARERVGGKSGDVFQNSAMRFGTEQEPLARIAYEDATGYLVQEVGFAFTEDRRFGCSVDGLVDDDGMVEIKTMVSSDTLFCAVVDGDISAYTDQINGALWLLGRKWCDLVLWAPDLSRPLHTIRIKRDENAIEALEVDLLAFLRVVDGYEAKLRAKLGAPANASIGNPPWECAPTDTAAAFTAIADLAPMF